ncbi:hypothetical protein DTO039G3_6179 [Penicillium roqueforti]|nr:hypothetical protein DTO039G3_6179 [Penicillium roqueforti]
MSDTGRKDLTTKAKKEPIPDPDQDKSKKDIIPDPNQDKSKESVTDTTERATRGLKTDDSKVVPLGQLVIRLGVLSASAAIKMVSLSFLLARGPAL